MKFSDIKSAVQAIITKMQTYVSAHTGFQPSPNDAAFLHQQLAKIETTVMSKLNELAMVSKISFASKQKLSSTDYQNNMTVPSRSSQNYQREIKGNYRDLVTEIRKYEKNGGTVDQLKSFFLRLQSLRFFVLREFFILKQTIELVNNRNKDANATKQLFQGELFVKGKGDTFAVQPNDVFQVAGFDCHFIAALAAVAGARSSNANEKGFIEKRITANNDGTFSVSYGKNKSVKVMPKFQGTLIKNAVLQPDGKYTNQTVPSYFALGDAGKELWPTLFRAAFAQYLQKDNPNANLNADGGSPDLAFKFFFGDNFDSFNLSEKNLAQITQHLKNTNPRSKPTVLGSGNLAEVPKHEVALLRLKPRHVYTFMGIVKDKDGEKVKLRDPRGAMYNPRPLTFAQIKKYFDGLVAKGNN